ncbi:MAG: large conductance mechanosensitive channel protein MscL [Defluviitaleaceae bacterium]|nr:large conductance mechanosensitive channel protein MscL [Defluviitaleaceae bacterium]
MRKFFKEFKEFALQGNIIAVAVGVLIGTSFRGIVESLTDNIISPIIGIFAGQNFDTLRMNVAGTTLYYGAFITAIINFFIMAFVVFLMVKAINVMMRSKDEAEEETKACPFCTTDISMEATRCPACTSVLEK